MSHSTHSPAQKGTSIDSIWLLIVGLLVGAFFMTVLGWMDWMPPQANVPHSTQPLTEKQVQEAVKNGSLQIHPY